MLRGTQRVHLLGQDVSTALGELFTRYFHLSKFFLNTKIENLKKEMKMKK